MSQAAAVLSQVPMSQNLGATLARASDAARAAGSGEVALEHVLLALCDDPDAEAVLSASQVNIGRLKSDTIGFLRTLPSIAPGAPLVVSSALTRILEAAAAAARGGRRRDINGAIVLAAIVGDGRTAAAQILQARGLTFDEAIRALQAALAPPGADAVPKLRGTDDVLKHARERVQSRAAPTLRDMIGNRPARPMPPPVPPSSGAPAEEPSPAEAMSEAQATETEEAAAPADRIDDKDTTSKPDADASGDDAEKVSGEAHSEPPPAEPNQVPEGVPPAQEASPPDYTYPQHDSASAPPQQAAKKADAPPPANPAAPPAQAAPPPAPAPSPQAGKPSGPQPPPFNVNLTRPIPVATPPPLPPTIPHGRSGAAMPPPPPGAGAGMVPPSRGGPPSQLSPFPPHPGPPGAPPQPRLNPEGFGAVRPSQSMPPPPSPYGNTGAATAPRSAPPNARKSPQNQVKPPRTAAAEIGQLAENIPRRMRVGVTERVEIRLAKAVAKAVTEGLDGGGQVWKHDVVVTKAMSVRLRAPEGGVFIETASPETQWLENNLGFDSDDFASWRFLVTPQSRGWVTLQIIVSARTIGADGMAAETALPDQVVEVKVRTNYKRTFLRWTGWLTAAVIGGALAKFGEGGFDMIMALLQKTIN